MEHHFTRRDMHATASVHLFVAALAVALLVLERHFSPDVGRRPGARPPWPPWRSW